MHNISLIFFQNICHFFVEINVAKALAEQKLRETKAKLHLTQEENVSQNSDPHRSRRLIASIVTGKTNPRA